MSELKSAEHFDGSRTAGENKSLLNDVWINTKDEYLAKVLSPEDKFRSSSEPASGRYLDCVAIPGYDSECAALRPEAARTVRAITTSGPEITTARPAATETRPTETRPETYSARPTGAATRSETPVVRAEVSRPDAPPARLDATATRSATERAAVERDRPIKFTTPRGDAGVRYRTPDARGEGTSEVEIDHLGVVRSLAVVDARGRRNTIAGERLAGLLSGTTAGTGDSPSPHAWRVSRSGSGDSAATTLTAPDGSTTYKLDSHGRLTGEVGSHRITPPRGVIPTDMGIGTRYDSTGAAGEVRSARTDNDGLLRGISIRSLSGAYRELNLDSLKSIKTDETVKLEEGWTATRGYFGDEFHYDSVRISHSDGTTYFVDPRGRLRYANNPIEASDTAARELPERATKERKSMGSLADDGTRYSTSDRRGLGTNHIDVDKLGIVRGFAHTAPSDGTRSLSMADVEKIPPDGMPHALRFGWRASRTGSGEDQVTTVVAPDGATTYRLDSTGALIRAQSSVEFAPYSSVVTTEIETGRRHDSVMSDGRIASGYVTRSGELSHITLKDKTGSTTITREQWERSLNDHLTNGDLGSGWRVVPTVASTFLPASMMIIHKDGTAFFLGTNGKFLESSASFAAERQRYLK